MRRVVSIFHDRFFLYTGAWLTYLVFSFLTFPIFDSTTMLASIVLVMVGARLYGFTGALGSTVLTIPYHAILLHYYSSSESALNPFGISTQLVASLSVATLQHAKKRLEQYNAQLEITVDERTQELNNLKHYIVQNSDVTLVVLSHTLLVDIGDSLADMHKKCDHLLNHLIIKDDCISPRIAKLKEMIRVSIDSVKNLGFTERFYAYEGADFSVGVANIARHYEKSVDASFDVMLDVEMDEIPKPVQHQLYRITQEAITNAVRHARADRISIHLTNHDNTYTLSITNNGLPLPEKIESGLGMTLMQNRIEKLGGHMEWKTTQNRNTQLNCIIPQRRD